VTSFDESTPSAPAARRVMTATANHLGYLPAATARWASSPQLLDGFQKLSGLFDTTTLDPVAREVVIMTIATRNDCHLCVAMHAARLTALRVLDTAGDVGEPALRAFPGHGYTERNALEVVLGIGTYVMSTLANRLTGAPVDDQVSAFA
jgi:AhpD family alkylhydroperoxidase